MQVKVCSAIAAAVVVLWNVTGALGQGEQKPVVRDVPPAKVNRNALAQEAKRKEAELQAHNAAKPVNGARITFKALDKAFPDKQTTPVQTFDGNPRSRHVVSFAPYIFRVDLVDTLPISELNFMLDHYQTAATVREVEVTLSDGTRLTKTLEPIYTSKENPMPRQTLKVDKAIDWFEVKVVTVTPGKNADGGPIYFGGIGEIEAISSKDLTAHLDVPDFNTDIAAFISGGSPRNDYSKVRVNMPPKIGLEGHPRIYLSRAEIRKWREELSKSERGRAALKTIVDMGRGLAEGPVKLPDPKVPAQLKDRGDAAAKAHAALSIRAGRLGWAYQLTDNEAYADKVREILMGYARLYPTDYAEHKGVNPHDSGKVMGQRLSEAMWLIPLIQAYDAIHDSKGMTEADRKLIENDLLRPALTFINGKHAASDVVKQRTAQNPNWRTEDPATGGKAAGNWVNFYNVAFIQAGIAMGDQDWIDVGAADTRLMIARGIGDDGMWKEGAIGYQNFARLALVACMEPLARQGIDVYSSNQARVKNLFDTLYKYAYPDGTMPGINDTARTSVGGDWMATAYDFGWLRYTDSNYGAAVNAAPRQIFQSEAVYFPTLIYEKLPEVPVQGVDSLIFDGLGYAIMRGQDGGQPTYMLLKCGKTTGGPHDHPDQLNLILFADGDELCGEPRFFRYEDPQHMEWTKTTAGHYSLTVDEFNQMPADGKLVAFHDAGSVKVMRGQSAGAYPGVGLDRTVVQLPGYVVDLYRAWGRKDRTFDYPLCFRGELASLKGVDAKGLKPAGESLQGYSRFMTLPVAAVRGNWSATWNRDAKAAIAATTHGVAAQPASLANEIKVTVVGDGETQVFTGVGPDGQHKVMLRRKGTSATFACVIDPYKAGDAVKRVESFKVGGAVPAYGLKVSRADGGTDLIIVRYEGRKEGQLAPESSFEGGTTDALVSVVRLDATGNMVELGLVGGTNLKYGGKTLNLEKPGIRWEK